MKKHHTFLVMAIICFAVMMFAGKNLGDAEARINAVASAPVQVLDLQVFHSEDDARTTLTAMGEEGRAIYRQALINWDILFPGFMCFTVILLRKSLRHWWTTLPKAFMLVPFTTLFLDFFENGQELNMISEFPNLFYGGTVTMLKWFGIWANMIVVIIMIIGAIVAVKKSKKPALRLAT